ncbi:MAG: hypothetical protein JAY75_22375 [Candidatus Thiodiazotropha taylori]|nr:hypothetical protein [Candidatus Thiodiazotropha taylori]MCG8078970.1 hypothetical protein [Candidatus Thiodiazotropha taylori]MCW4310966.1 hypothetical protein [Candidatus Thiodiazotropha endolucinida]MCW4336851.1 hypothetical protein [Candidatus Thiodiazotropha endolucinida]
MPVVTAERQKRLTIQTRPILPPDFFNIPAGYRFRFKLSDELLPAFKKNPAGDAG